MFERLIAIQEKETDIVKITVIPIGVFFFRESTVEDNRRISFYKQIFLAVDLFENGWINKSRFLEVLLKASVAPAWHSPIDLINYHKNK